MGPEERNNLEFIAVKSLLSSDVFFDTALEKYSNLEDIFKLSYHKDIIKALFTLHKKQKRKPSLNDMYNYLRGEVQEHFKNHITKAQLTHQDVIIDLVNDNLRSEAIYIQNECLHLEGLEYVTEVQKSFTELLNNLGLYSKGVSNEDRVTKVVEEIKLIKENKNFSRYISTGYESLDEKIIGFKKGGITIIGARPSQGKTSFCLNLKENLKNSGFRTLFFSIEMQSEDLTYKDLSYYSEINSMKIESGDLTDSEFEKVQQVSEYLKGEDYIYIDDGKQTIEKICARTRQELLKGKVDAIFIDYLTLIDMSYDFNQHVSIEKGMGILRTFAKETDIPIILISQLNRKVEERQNKVPILADIRASGSIEQDATQIIFLYRPHYYFPEENLSYELITDDNTDLEYGNALRVIVAKARGGKTGDVILEYKKEIQKINNTRKKFPDERYDI